ncbi:hypothetical membrane protein [Anaerolinea thermophila UNI-1]|uniref:Hypothetical membrane protein n=2 Tax=Anaerolinea thermophila TaxID=167964 RepID=E8N419_ANATU|nr:hypothetical membrane protein [Anaerolinea thermophila UNI-1]
MYNRGMSKTTRLWIVLLIALALLARLIPGPRTIDDSYITYRYARNLLSGWGFVYNPGERVMGTTTPLYTLLMAGLGALSGGPEADFPVISWLLNAVADALTCVLLFLIGRQVNFEKAGLAAALAWAIAPYSVTFSIGGLETSLYVFLLTLMGWAYLRNNLSLTALAGALALLTRVDAALMIGLMGLDWLARFLHEKPRSIPWRALFVFLLPVIGWYGFAWAYFGSPFPHSVTAKLLAYRLEPHAALIRLLQHYATPFFEYHWIGNIAIGVGLLVYPFLALTGVLSAFRTAPRLGAWLVYPWVYFLAFALPNPLIFRWYLTPPLPAYFLAILIGGQSLLRGLMKHKQVPRWGFSLLTVVLVLFPAVVSFREWRFVPDHGPRRPAPDMAYIQLELLYKEAADFIRAQNQPQAVLAAGDVGVLGYETNLRILDTVGLNSPQSIQYYPLDKAYYAINYAVAPDLIRDARPDFLVILEVYGRKGLLQENWFQQSYRLMKKIPTDMYGSDGLLIFGRNP